MKTINDQEKEVIVFRFQDFENKGYIYPDSLTDIVKFKKPEIPTPKPHQTEAKEDVVQSLKSVPKANSLWLVEQERHIRSFGFIRIINQREH